MPNKKSTWQLWPEKDRVIKNWDPSAMKVWSPYQASNAKSTEELSNGREIWRTWWRREEIFNDSLGTR